MEDEGFFHLINKCRDMLDAGRDINDASFVWAHGSFLKEPICRGSVATVRALLEMNCDPNAEVNSTSPSLHHACIHGKVDMIRLLLDSKASPCILAADGSTALHIATSYMNHAAMELLLSHGAPLDIKSHTGITPFDLAVVKHNGPAIRLFLDYGLSVATIPQQDMPNWVSLIVTGHENCKMTYFCMVAVMRKRVLFGHVQVVPDMIKFLASYVWASRFDLRWQNVHVIKKNKK